jgi:hypothetical protein
MVIAQYGSAWSNAGAITVQTGGMLTLGGTFSLAGAGDIVNDGGFVRISGTLDNTGETYTPGTGIVSNKITLYSDGKILGGTVDDPADVLVFQSGTLDGVTYDTPLLIGESQSLTIENGITMAGTNPALTLGSGNSLQFYGATSLDNMVLTLGTNDSVSFTYNSDPLLGPNFVLRDTGARDNISLGGTTLDNEGLIDADTIGGSLTFARWSTTERSWSRAARAWISRPSS